jgi:hypothetical protein
MINLWHVLIAVGAYLVVGVVLYLPLNLLALTRVPDLDERSHMRRRILRLRPFLLQVVAWPLSISEEWR